MNEAEQEARRIAAEMEARTGRKVKSVEVTIRRTSRTTERHTTTRTQRTEKR